METTRGNIGDVQLEHEGRPMMTGLIVQAKKGKRPNPWSALREAVEGMPERTDELHAPPLPIAVIHKDQERPGQGAEQMVAMSPEVFAHLYHAYYNRVIDLPADTDASL